MTRKSRVLLAIGALAGTAVLAIIYLRPEPAPQSREDDVAAHLDERRELDETVWAREVLAQKHEETIVKYWDRMLRPEDDKYAVLAEFPFQTITLDAPGESFELDWGIKRTIFGGQSKTLDREGWREFLRDMENRGYAIDAIEFHQSEFDDDVDGKAVSVYNILLNVINEDTNHRWIVRSKLRIEWTGEMDEEGLYVPGALTLYDTTVLDREGPPPFEHSVLRDESHDWSYPIAYDLNRDGLSDILLPASNTVMWNRGNGHFEERTLFLAPGIAPPTQIWTAIAADFTRDGHVDLLCSGIYKNTLPTDPSRPTAGIYLFQGDKTGHFLTPGKRVASPSLSLTSPICVTAGDIDADGDLDIWLAQYKGPYESGSMPTPFYDANDGYPSYLLLNRGDGVFDDKTEEAGLAHKRYRRTYAASFVDLDGDHDLDLLVSSDFAGTDIHYNDGSGHFTDETNTVLDVTANFGMGHTLADFNQDGVLDFYVIGMASTTMRRLNQMGLIRQDRPEFLEMRTLMAYGNRMFLGLGSGTFREPDFKDSVSRSGWSWGTTSFDFDSDGDMDVYVANGFVSGQTTKDYCTIFWRHDIYTGDSQVDPVLSDLFEKTHHSYLGDTLSWDGYQKNHLFMNQSGKDFVNVAFLMNVALGDDSRSVISDDFDGDGRPDLLVTSKHLDRVGERRYDTHHLFMNRWPIRNNWIGVRLQVGPGGPSTIGAVIQVRSKMGRQIAHIVTGDSFRAQHAPMKHFGLGSDTVVESIEVHWPDGTIEALKDPAINMYHVVESSGAR